MELRVSQWSRQSQEPEDGSPEAGARVGLNGDLGMVGSRLQPLGTLALCPRQAGSEGRLAVVTVVYQELGSQPGTAAQLAFGAHALGPLTAWA